MKFNRKIQLIEQLLLEIMDITDNDNIGDENIQELFDEVLEMKKQEVLEIVEMGIGKSLDEEYKDICWAAYLLGEMK